MTLTTPRILIMAGGTGGHVFPALTIARELMATGTQVEWLGTRQGLEARVIGDTDIPLHFISISGLRGKNLLTRLLSPAVILIAVVQAVLTIRRIKPSCVLGMGGFVTGPGGVAARLMGKKLLIHEQNAVAGLTNQLLFPLAHAVMEAFPGAFVRKQHLGSSHLLKRLLDLRKIVITGNPVRSDILALAPPASRFAAHTGKLRLLVVGGSLGAATLNSVVPQMLASMNEAERPLVRHQCGNRNFEQTAKEYRTAGLANGTELELLPFIDDMAEAYAWADVIICRAGASTIAELAVIGLPAILVPYLHAVDDHQRENARVLEQTGAARVILQNELDADRLKQCLYELAPDRAHLLQHAQAAMKVAIRDASGRAASLCLEACRG